MNKLDKKLRDILADYCPSDCNNWMNHTGAILAIKAAFRDVIPEKYAYENEDTVRFGYNRYHDKLIAILEGKHD